MKKLLTIALTIAALTGCDQIKESAESLVVETVKDTATELKNNFKTSLEESGINPEILKEFEQIKNSEIIIKELTDTITKIQTMDINNIEIFNQLESELTNSLSCLNFLKPETKSIVVDELLSIVTVDAKILELLDKSKQAAENKTCKMKLTEI